MDDFGETLSSMLVFVLVLVLFFLFQGEPDVWDSLRAMAMGACKP